MLQEKQKSARIMKEMITYFLSHHFHVFDLHFEETRQYATFTIQGASDKSPDDFQQILDELNTPRDPEIDEYFSGLLGSHCEAHDFTFLGKAIDEAEGTFSNGQLVLKITRYH